MKVFLVVGSGYGDEGKGLATDWLVHYAQNNDQKPLVIRANGGTQAAHTVQTPEGARHVFNHHGSGSFLGADTFLGPEFLVNPAGFFMERERLPEVALKSKIYVSPRAKLTLPCDMMLNQMAEQQRGSSKHGSCGWGIGETMRRNTEAWPGLGLTVAKMLDSPPRFSNVDFLREISLDYFYLRAEALRASGMDIPEEWRQRAAEPAIYQKWAEQLEDFLSLCTVAELQDVYKGYGTLVFEGAQGLGLDENGEHFPHVTWSRTGSDNPLELLKSIPENLDVSAFYITRAYATRHGAGPLEHEGLPHGCSAVDPTNVDNQWQDSLRTAPLDLEIVSGRIAHDFVKVRAAFPEADFNLLMTCLDQVGENYFYVASPPMEDDLEHRNPHFAAGRLVGCVASKLREGYRMNLGGFRVFSSSGPTREDVQLDVHIAEELVEA